MELLAERDMWTNGKMHEGLMERCMFPPACKSEKFVGFERGGGLGDNYA